MNIRWQDPLTGFWNGYSLARTIGFEHEAITRQEPYEASFFQVAYIGYIHSAVFSAAKLIKHPFLKIALQVSALISFSLVQIFPILLAAIKKGDYKHFAQNPKIQEIIASNNTFKKVIDDVDNDLPELSKKNITSLETATSYLPLIAKIAKGVEVIAYVALGNYVYASAIVVGLGFSWLDAHRFIPLQVSRAVHNYSRPLCDIATLLDPASFILFRTISMIYLVQCAIRQLSPAPIVSAKLVIA